jgi:hypothetical protein
MITAKTILAEKSVFSRPLRNILVVPFSMEQISGKKYYWSDLWAKGRLSLACSS